MEDGTKLKKVMSVMTLMLAFIALVIASIGASFSFAWFSEYSTAQIQEVNFNSQAVTNIGFTGPGGDRPQGTYLGQTAFDSIDGKLILGNEPNKDQKYYADKAYECSVPIKVTSNKKTVSITITKVEIIKSGGEVGDTLVIDTAHITHGFTWYMIPQLDAAKVYTPYGLAEQTFTETTETKGKVVYKRIGTEPDFIYQKLEKPDEYAGTKYCRNTITAFSNSTITLDSEGQTYDFYLVFCPEKLFWAQYNDATKIKVQEQYTSVTDQNWIYYNQAEVPSADPLQSDLLDHTLYYSKLGFKGSKFVFNVRMGTI